MEFYYVRLLKHLIESENIKAATHLFRLIDILNSFAYIKRLLYSKEDRGFRFEQRLSYHIENFYMRVYIFREGFYLFLNEAFDLRAKEGDIEFRKKVWNIINKDEKLSFLIKALGELKKHDVIKKCLQHWRKIEHQVMKAYNFSRHIGLIEALGRKKLSESEKYEIIKKILNQTDDDIEKVCNFLTDFLERYCKEIFLRMEEQK